MHHLVGLGMVLNNRIYLVDVLLNRNEHSLSEHPKELLVLTLVDFYLEVPLKEAFHIRPSILCVDSSFCLSNWSLTAYGKSNELPIN